METRRATFGYAGATATPFYDKCWKRSEKVCKRIAHKDHRKECSYRLTTSCSLALQAAYEDTLHQYCFKTCKQSCRQLFRKEGKDTCKQKCKQHCLG